MSGFYAIKSVRCVRRQPCAWLSTVVVDVSMVVDNQNRAEIGVRMKAAREALRLTQDGLAKAVGASKRGIQDNEAQKSVPGGDVIAGMVKLGINANWLLTGNGLMLLADLEAIARPAPMKINRGALAALLRGAVALTSQGVSVELAADMAAEMYERALLSGEITPDGIGEGSLSQAA